MRPKLLFVGFFKAIQAEESSWQNNCGEFECLDYSVKKKSRPRWWKKPNHLPLVFKPSFVLACSSLDFLRICAVTYVNASSFVIVMEYKAPFGPLRKCIWFYCWALKANIPSHLLEQSQVCFNASWRGLSVALIVKFTCLETTWYKMLSGNGPSDELGLQELSWAQKHKVHPGLWWGTWLRVPSCTWSWMTLHDVLRWWKTWIAAFWRPKACATGNSLYPCVFC